MLHMFCFLSFMWRWSACYAKRQSRWPRSGSVSCRPLDFKTSLLPVQVLSTYVSEMTWNEMIWYEIGVEIFWNILKCVGKLRDGKCSSVCCNTLGLKRGLEAAKSWQMWQLGWLICQTDRPSSAANLEHDHRKSWFETRIEMPAVGSRFYNCWSGDPHFTCRSWAVKPAILTGLDSLDKKEIHKVNMDDTIFTIFIGYGKHMETFDIFPRLYPLSMIQW